MIGVIISSRICSLIIAISDLEELIRPHVRWSWKLGLWSFKAINASFFASFSMRLSYLLARIVTCAYVRDTVESR